jgi:hypothetical protein
MPLISQENFREKIVGAAVSFVQTPEPEEIDALLG